MGVKEVCRLLFASADQKAVRLTAIKSIVENADDEEVHEVVAEALLVLGASPEELTAAMFGASL